jgi:hypothetical protein
MLTAATTPPHILTREPLRKMAENYNTGTCTIRVGHDYVCLNFGSKLAASVSVRDRGTRRTRSKWSRVLRYSAKYKSHGEPLDQFIRRKGGINECAERFTRCLGRGGRS